MPFLQNVLRGRNVPEARMLEVAEHYQHFGGVSPINQQNRELIAALKEAMAADGLDLPIYWGNRNWHPMLADTLAEMKRDGVQRALAFMTSMFSCYSGCRQYREDVARAQEKVGEGAPAVDKIRMGFNHPGFIDAQADRVKSALSELPDSGRQRKIIFTAHSIPLGMASGCMYEEQLRSACQLVADQAGVADWRLAFQSRSGPPTQPWLEPDICDVLREEANGNPPPDVVCCPIGFISDHMEVLFDLDTEAKEAAEEGGIHFVRAATVGVHPRFLDAIIELIRERTDGMAKQALGQLGPSHDVCPDDCCPSGRPAR